MSAPLGERLQGRDARTRLEALREVMRSDVGDDIVRLVIGLLADPDARVRCGALEVLAIGSDAGRLTVDVELWRRALELRRDPDPSVRAQVAVAMATLPHVVLDEATPALLGLLRDDAPPVRREAAAALGDLRIERAREPLAERLDQDPDPETQFEAAFALATLRDERALGPMLEALGTKRFTDACTGLERLGDPRAIEAVTAQATRVFIGWPERIIAHGTLYRLGAHDVAREYLLSRLSAWNRGERELAIATLGHLAVPEAREPLERIAADRKDRGRGVAITALGNLGDRRSLELLATLATDASVADDVAYARAALEKPPA